MSKKRRVRFGDPTARKALQRVTASRRAEGRNGYELHGIMWLRYCTDPSCLGH
jgi:hypothetical protein